MNTHQKQEEQVNNENEQSNVHYNYYGPVFKGSCTFNINVYTCGNDKPDVDVTSSNPAYQILTDHIRHIFEIAIAEGLLKRNGQKFEWLASKVLLDYFCGRIFCKDQPVEGVGRRPTWCFTQEVIIMPSKELNFLFDRDDIGVARQKMHGGELVPKNYEQVEKVLMMAA